MKLYCPSLALVMWALATFAVVEAGTQHTVRFVRSSGSPQRVRALAFSPDASTVAVSTSSGQVSFVQTADGEINGRYRLSPFAMAYSRDGSRLFMISESSRSLINTAVGEEIDFELQEEPGFIGINLVRRNGKLLISHIERDGPVDHLGTIQVGDELVAIGQGKAGRLTKLVGAGVGTAINRIKGPAGTYVRLEIITRGKLRPTSHLIRRQPKQTVNGQLRFVSFEGNRTQENLVWCIQDGRHTFGSAATGRTIAALETEEIKNIGQYALSPNSEKFAVLAKRRQGTGSAIEVFDIAKQQREKLIAFPKDTWCAIAFSNDATQLLIATRYTVEVLNWDQQRYEQPITLGRPPVRKVSRSGGAGGAGSVFGSALDEFVSSSSSGRPHVESLAVSSDGLVGIGAPSGTVELWDLEKRERITTFETAANRPVDLLRFSPDGRWLAYYSAGVLYLTDVEDVAAPREVVAK